MPALDSTLLEWAVRCAAPGADITEVRGLRDGGSPWLLRLSRAGVHRGIVLRVGDAQDPAPLRTEAAALRLAADHNLPAPGLLAAHLDSDPPVVLAELLTGSSLIPATRPVVRLRALGAAAAALHAIPLAPSPALPRRDQPIAGVDFAALRREAAPDPLLLAAEQRLASHRPTAVGEVFVHGDLWQGNALWNGDTLVGLIDWDCAGAGPAGVDLGSLRSDAAFSFGLDAADDVLHGWQEAAGRPAEDVAYWDVVAALSSPPDLGWFVGAYAGQGRPDLSRPLMIQRRDAFLRAALDRLDSSD